MAVKPKCHLCLDNGQIRTMLKGTDKAVIVIPCPDCQPQEDTASNADDQPD